MSAAMVDAVRPLLEGGTFEAMREAVDAACASSPSLRTLAPIQGVVARRDAVCLCGASVVDGLVGLDDGVIVQCHPWSCVVVTRDGWHGCTRSDREKHVGFIFDEQAVRFYVGDEIISSADAVVNRGGVA